MIQAFVEFQGQRWSLDLDYTLDKVSINVSLKKASHIIEYSNSFSSSYIHSLTTRVGNYKPFNVFIEMILDGIKSQNSRSRTNTPSGVVTIDLVTGEDLLSQSKQKNAQPSPAEMPSKKIYLVLTYAVAYDRVHYPLPLLCKTHDNILPEPKQQRRDIKDTGHKKWNTDQQVHMSNESDNDIRMYQLALQRVTHLSPLQVLKQVQRLEYLNSCLKMETGPTSSSKSRTQARNASNSRLKPTNEILEEAIDILNQIVDPDYVPKVRISHSSVKSGYKVIKSEPLVPKSSRPKSTPRTTSRTPTAPTPNRINNRSSSASNNASPRESSASRPFKRFDPTEYVRQRNEKRSSSVSSRGSSNSIRRSNSVPSRTNSKSRMHAASSNRDKEKTARVSSNARRKESKPEKRMIDLDDEIVVHDTTIEYPVTDDDIDARLKRLEVFLQSV
jgi:coiled-coil domain-containing protein 61